MNKLLTTITLLCFSVAANAETYVCTDKKRSVTSHPRPRVNPDYNVSIRNDASGYIVNTDRGIRFFNAEGDSEPNFGGSCDVNAVIITCTHDRDGDFWSVLINIRDGLIFTASRTNAYLQHVVASVGTCIKL